jgi:hypothetical protein
MVTKLVFPRLVTFLFMFLQHLMYRCLTCVLTIPLPFNWENIHVTISLFKVVDTSGQSTRFDLNENKIVS